MANLQDATRLISDLTSKLAELDSKVAAYRLDMAAEFTRHSEELLRSIPEDVAYRVSQAIADHLTNYPSLYPPGSLSSSRSATPTRLDETPWRGTGSPPPSLAQTAGNPDEPEPESPRQWSQHEREQEFQGLFTPTYLPLLESVDRPLHSPPTSPTSPGKAAAPRFGRRTSFGSAQGSDDSHHHHHHRPRPTPLRRATDTSIDSIVSDSSSAKTRKSALRRSSGSSKADSPRDPRRVRFDFQGQEVLPSSSPQTSTTTLNKSDGVREKSALADESYTTSLGDIEGEEDLRGEQPRKVSSTQALRALSKAPLDEGTVWTVVNPETEPEGFSDADKNRQPTTPALLSRTDPKEDVMTTKDACGQAQAHVTDEARDGQPALTKEQIAGEAEQDDSDEEPALFMASKRGLDKKRKEEPPQDQKGRVSFSAKGTSPMAIDPQPLQLKRPRAPPNPAKPKTAGIKDPLKAADKEVDAKTHNTAVKVKEQLKEHIHTSTDFEDDDEGFFDFDDDNEKAKMKAVSSPPKKYLTTLYDEEHEEDGKPDRVTDTTESYSNLPSSPPISIPDGPGPRNPIPPKVPPKPEGTRAPSTSIGSFVDRDGHKRSLTPGPVKDMELLEKLEKLDVDAPFFVGSVNGNSGVDASNVKSYQASLLSPTQTSGSFAERLMWEKAQGITYDSDKEGDKDDKNAGR